MVRISSHRIVTRKRRIVAYILHYVIRVFHIAWQIVTLGLRRRRAIPKDIRKVLVIRADGLGDLIMSLPAMTGLRRLYPKAEITLLAGSPSEILLPHLECFDRTLILDLPWAQRSVRRLRWRDLRRVVRQIKQDAFDLIIDFRGDFRNVLLMLYMGGRCRVGYEGGGCGFLLDLEIPAGEERHEVDHKLDCVRALGGETGDVRFDLKIPDQDSAFADRLISELGLHVNRFVVLHPGAQWQGREWAPSGYSGVADRIIRDLGFPVAITGIERERGLCGEVASRMGEEPINLVGTLTFGQYLALLSRARLFVGVDSGPMHLAAAFGTPTVALFGAGDPDSIGPYGPGHAIISKADNFNCSPCSQESCPHEGASCMDAITVDEVWEAVEAQIHSVQQMQPRREPPTRG